jgi:hypothetical protein
MAVANWCLDDDVVVDRRMEGVWKANNQTALIVSGVRKGWVMCDDDFLVGKEI